MQSPVPRRAVLVELVRAGSLLAVLLLSTLLFVLIGAWLVGAALAGLLVAVVLSGLVPRRSQVAAARHPSRVTTVELKPWERRREVWAALTREGPEGLCVPLRSRAQARRLLPGPYQGLVAGDLEAGRWVVLQVGQVTFWPAGPVRHGLPAGAAPVGPRRFRRHR